MSAIKDFEEKIVINLPPEEEEGNVEYKLKLINPTEKRLEHLVTQMKWRLEEGKGEAIYKIGVEDNGTCAGLSDNELESTMNTLKKMAERLEADFSVLRKTVVSRNTEERRQIAELLVRKVPDNQQFLDIRISVLGSVDAGKSTLLGVLCHGNLDDGQGHSRMNLFRHQHEVQSGRTSSISHKILGFDSKGNVVNFSTKDGNRNRTAEEICAESSKIVTFIDLAGHQKYLKTTIFGLTSNQPDFTMIVVAADRGITNTTREHLGYALALQVPTIVVVTKTDLCQGNQMVETTKQQIDQLFTGIGCGKIPYHVKDEDAAYTAASQMSSTSNLIPCFTTSSVSGDNINLLKNFLNVLPPRKNAVEQEELMQKPVMFQVDELFTVPEVGVVVGGTLTSGCIGENADLLIGPSSEGKYERVKVTTIQRNRTPCRLVRAGQAASLSLQGVGKDDVRKGMVLVSEGLNPACCMRFTATIFLLYHPSKHLCEGSQLTIHVDNVVQTAILEKIHNEQGQIKTSEQAEATFCFVCHPEHLETCSTLLFRERSTRGMGQITSIEKYQHHQHNTQVKKRTRRSSQLLRNNDDIPDVTNSNSTRSAKRQFVVER